MKPHSTVYAVSDFGAVGDGVTLDTTAVQTAIDVCHRAGGGIVLFPTGGRYLIGTIYLKSHVTLHVAENAAIWGSQNIDDYTDDTGQCPYYPEPLDPCLIHARGTTNIGLTGGGVIDGRYKDDRERHDDPLAEERIQRPMLIRLTECENLHLESLTLRGAFSWCVHIQYCFDVKIRGLTVRNDRQDGFNIESSRDVIISDCLLQCGDDGIALTTSRRDAPLSGLTVSNCVVSSRWAAFRIGPLSKGDFENIVVTGCVFRDCGGGGIKIGMFEGAAVRNAIFSSIVMDRVTAPILIMNARWTSIGSRDAEPPLMPPGAITDLLFSDIIVKAHQGPTPPWDPSEYDDDGLRDFLVRPDRNATIFIHGHKDGVVDRISLRGIRLELPGGGRTEEGALEKLVDMHEIDIAEHGYWTDDKTVWGIPVASAVYARHIGNLRIRDLAINHRETEDRPPMGFVDCTKPRFDDVTVDGKDLEEDNVIIR